MPNVALIKDDENPLILPAETIVAIISAVSDKASKEDHPAAQSVVVSNFRKFSVHFLLQSPEEVLAEVSSRELKDRKRTWVSLPCGESTTHLERSSIISMEGVSWMEAEGDVDENETEIKMEPRRALRVWYLAPNGRELSVDVDYSQEASDHLTRVLMEDGA